MYFCTVTIINRRNIHIGIKKRRSTFSASDYSCNIRHIKQFLYAICLASRPKYIVKQLTHGNEAKLYCQDIKYYSVKRNCFKRLFFYFVYAEIEKTLQGSYRAVCRGFSHMTQSFLLYSIIFWNKKMSWIFVLIVSAEFMIITQRLVTSLSRLVLSFEKNSFARQNVIYIATLLLFINFLLYCFLRCISYIHT